MVAPPLLRLLGQHGRCAARNTAHGQSTGRGSGVSARLAAGPMPQGFIVLRDARVLCFGRGKVPIVGVAALASGSCGGGHVAGQMDGFAVRWFDGIAFLEDWDCQSACSWAMGEWERDGSAHARSSRRDHPAILAPDKLPELLIGGLARLNLVATRQTTTNTPVACRRGRRENAF